MSNDLKRTVLAFDTAMGGISVGVIASNGHVVSRQLETQREQASLLIPVIQDVLKEAQIEFADIDLIVSSVGPGSFTGLRIGLTTAKVLSFSLDVPLVGLNTMEVMAHHYETGRPLLIVLETKRKDFYFQYYDTDRTYLTDPSSALCEQVLDAAPVAGFDIGGDCLNRFQESFPGKMALLENWVQPDPIIMAQLGLDKFEASGAQDIVEPLYLREADVSEPKKKPRKLSQT